MFLPRVGRIAIYSGQYHNHWEAGVGINVVVLPVRHLVVGSVLVIVLAAAIWLDLISWALVAFAALMIIRWISGAARERWLPSELPDESACVAAYGALRREVTFEGIVEPKQNWFDGFINRRDRKVNIVRYVESTASAE